MSRIWAVARHMIAEGIRTKTAVVFMALMGALLVVLPFTVAGDGVTLKSRIQSLLSYSLGSVGALLSLLTVFLACSTLANEVRARQIFMIACKPIPRWQFFAGKWLGIVVMDAALLLVAGAAVWAGTWYLKSQPTYPDDRAAVDTDVLTVRYGAKIEEPDFAPMVEERIRKLREEGRLSETSADGRRGIRQDIYDELKAGWRTMRPGEYKDFTFKNLLVNREDPKALLYLHFKPRSSAGVEDTIFKARWRCGDRNDINTLGPLQEADFIVGRFHSVPVPAWAVNKDGVLYVRMQNVDSRDTIVFEGSDSFEVLYDIGTFHWNLFRALAIVWCRLAFLAVLGLAASTFLSFPVAAMVTFLVMLVATASGFLTEAIAGVAQQGTLPDPLWIVGPVLRPIASIFVALVPDFSKFDPVGTVVAGRVVPLIWVIQSLVKLVLIQGLALGVLGGAIFTRRELAQVTV